MSGTIAKPDRLILAPSRAARELDLKRGDFDLAVNLGLIRTVPDEGGGGLCVARAEIDRLRAEDRFPEVLRERVATVGTSEGAGLLGVTPARFTSLARYGLLVPVRFYLNRYRAVVWLYLAEELRQFAAEGSNARLLKGRTPAQIREGQKDGLDRRPRNWRGRQVGFLTRQDGHDAWAHAAAVAALLDPADVAEAVTDPYERAHLDLLRPRLPAHGAPGSPAAERAETLMTASEPDEVAWFLADLAHTMETARRHHPAPRPVPEPAREPAPASPAEPTAPPPAPAGDRPEAPDRTPPHGLLGWLHRRGRRHSG
ncbi:MULTISPECIES: DUF6397 family protein [Streptomyces]|uniref:DNA-binding protein n=1 Tax=Streptomyces koelreuteriae TaxID=2838015 RepID=A0ABX8G0X6_9ACTN|nr:MULTISPECIES: DUF6397 family protein [Streptomyces]QWB27141.1 hypothetical protein KJK29_33610 [Streptomyces koelreuteriae]UUA10221.1 DUF6397 family protein [Streptomyces koelreuteriae]UUA17827.1 DUF6397 family protein [Streptomyces sp. CRCS-T-1]